MRIERVIACLDVRFRATGKLAVGLVRLGSRDRGLPRASGSRRDSVATERKKGEP